MIRIGITFAYLAVLFVSNSSQKPCLGQVLEVKKSAQVDNSFKGEWVVVSTAISGTILPDESAHSLFLGDDFFCESKVKPFATGGPTKAVMIYDTVWRQDNNQKNKWTAVLYGNPDPALGLEKHCDETISGYLVCWISSNTSVIVFSEAKIELELADLKKLEKEGSLYFVYSAYRRTSDAGQRKAHAKEFLDILREIYGGHLDEATHRLYGGWEKELEHELPNKTKGNESNFGSDK